MNIRMPGVVALLTLIGAVCPRGSGDEPARDANAGALEKFDGNWELVSSTSDGEQADLGEVRGRILVFEVGRMAAVERDHAVGYGIIRVDPREAPARVDWKYGDSPAKTGISEGIYRFDGDRLTICTGGLDPGNGRSKFRPSRFESRKGSATTLLVYTKVDRGIRLRDLHFPSDLDDSFPE